MYSPHWVIILGVNLAMEDRKGMFWFIQGNVRVLIFCRLLWSWSTSIVDPFFSLYILALGGTPTEVGLINSIGILAGMFLYPVGGYLADKAGRVKLIGYSTMLYAIAHIPFVLAQDWKMLALAQFLTHVLLFYSPAMNALSSDSLPPGVRGRGFAIMMAVPQAIRILSPYIGGKLIEWYSVRGSNPDAALVEAIRLAWGVALVTGFIVAYVRLRYLKETVKAEDAERYGWNDSFTVLKESYRSIIESIKWMNRSLKTIVVIEMIASFFIAMSAPFWVVFAYEVVGLNAGNWGEVNLVSGVVGLLFALPLGQAVDRWGPKKTILAGMIAAPFVIFLYQYAQSFWVVAIMVTLITLCNKIMIPGFSTLIANMIPRERRGRLYSLLGERGVTISWGNFWGGGFLLFPPAALGSYIGGLVYTYSPMLLWQITSIAIFACTVLIYLFVHEPDEAQE